MFVDRRPLVSRAQWVKAHIEVPSAWQHKERVALDFDPGCEALVYSNEGLPLQGITGGGDANRRVDWIIPEDLRKHPFTIWIEVSANAMFGLDPNNANEMENRYFTLELADVIVYRMDAWRLFWDFNTIRDISNVVPQNQSLSPRALGIANEIANTFDADDLHRTIPLCRKLAERIYGEGWAEKGAKVYDGDFSSNDKHPPQVWSVSNCHIGAFEPRPLLTHTDTAWLWPFSVTQQKVARSWSSQCNLMDRYPEHTFAVSQAQQYKWLEKLYPKLFSVVRSKIDEGRFQPIGGCWVESACGLVES